MEDSFTARFGMGPLVINFISILIISYVAKGDRKRALVRLRAVSTHKTHHFSSFRTGIALGLAFPATIDAIVRCESSNNSTMLAEHPSGLQPHTRVDIPSWATLLFIYANLLVPTLLAFLVGTNLLIWTASRINYVFIFGTVSRNSLQCQDLSLIRCEDLDIRTRLDHREYFEVHSRRLCNT